MKADETPNESVEAKKMSKKLSPGKRQEKKELTQKSVVALPAELSGSGQESKTQIEWRAQEFVKHPKDAAWFLAVGIVALIVAAFAIYSKNFIFALIIILSVFLIFIWSQKEPKKIKFAVAPKGIKIAEEIYNFENLKSFWIFYDPPDIKYLSIISKKLFMPKIIIPLGETNPNKVRELFLKYLPEEKQEESMIDVLGRYLRY